MGWIEQVKRHPLTAVARSIGLVLKGRAMGPCPACRADTRGSADPRLPIAYGNDGGWKCYACEASGDAVDLLACAVAGHRLRECGPSEREDVSAKAAELGLSSGFDGAPPRADLGAGVVQPRGFKSARSARLTATDRRETGDEDTVLVDEDLDGVTELHVPEDSPDPVGKKPRGGRAWSWDPGLSASAQVLLWEDPEAEPVRRYLTAGPGELPGGADGRRLSRETCRKWKLGAYKGPEGEWWVTIPLLDSKTGEPVNIRFRRVPGEDGKTGRPKYRVCAGRPLPLFGVRAMSDDLGAPVLICEGELDVVALYEYGFERSVVSGSAGAQTWADEWLDVLEPYSSFVLVYDGDEAGEKGVELVAEKLGRYRVSRAELPRKDAGECLLHSVPVEEVERAIGHARPLIDTELLHPSAWRREIEHGIAHREELVGLPTGSERLDKMFGGIPTGLTVLTGDSGAGKTSFGTWLLYEQALRGVPVGFTSFEQHMRGSTQKLLRMQLGGDFLDQPKAAMDEAYRAIDSRIWIVNKYGRMEVPKLIETIRYGRRRHGIRVWLVDHLGFLIDSSRDDERRQIDHLVRTLTLLANDENLSVIMIAHPHQARAEQGQSRRVRLRDLKGSSAIEQDAALGLVVQANDPEKYGGPSTTVYNEKQRSEWGEGSGSYCILYMDPQAILYADEAKNLPMHRGGR